MVEISGGDKLEKAMQELARKLGRGGEVRVGYLAASHYPDGTPTALIGAIMEFGSARIPPRPAIRSMIAAKAKGWPESAASILKHTNNNVPLTLQLLGEGIKGQWVESMRDLTSPPLAPTTIARKGFSKPLIESGHLISSVAVEVDA